MNSHTNMLLIASQYISDNDCTCCVKCQQSRLEYGNNVVRPVDMHTYQRYEDDSRPVYKPSKTKIFRPEPILPAYRNIVTPYDNKQAYERQEYGRLYTSLKRSHYITYNESPFQPPYKVRKIESRSISDPVMSSRQKNYGYDIDNSRMFDNNAVKASQHAFQPIITLPSPSTTPPDHNHKRNRLVNDTVSLDSASSDEEERPIDEKIQKKHHEKSKYERTIKLYTFIIDLLEKNHACVTWIKRESGIFKINDSEKLATLWGEVKLNASMTYEKLARSFRHYYKQGILDNGETVISPVSKCGKRKLFYKFSAPTLKRFLNIDSV